MNLNSRMIITRDKHKDGKKGKKLGAGCHNNEHPKAGPVFLLFFLCRLSQNLLSKVLLMHMLMDDLPTSRTT